MTQTPMTAEERLAMVVMRVTHWRDNMQANMDDLVRRDPENYNRQRWWSMKARLNDYNDVLELLAPPMCQCCGKKEQVGEDHGTYLIPEFCVDCNDCRCDVDPTGCPNKTTELEGNQS